MAQGDPNYDLPTFSDYFPWANEPKAQKCPVCEGIGTKVTYYRKIKSFNDPEINDLGKEKNEQCHGCDGKGWVTV